MRSPNWNDDDQLLRDLGRALDTEPVDERFLHAARAAFAWRDVDAELELAGILYDSLVDEAAPVRGQAPGTPRTIVFQGDDVGMEIELGEAGIEGQLIPPASGCVTLSTAGGSRTETPTDDIGCFAFPAPPRGPIRLTCTLGTTTLTTEWITV